MIILQKFDMHNQNGIIFDIRFGKKKYSFEHWHEYKYVYLGGCF